MKRKYPKPAKPAPRPQQMKTVYLAGGPAHGMSREIPVNAERVRVGLWHYTYAGKMDGRIYFAIALKSRAANSGLFKLIGALGRDPRVETIAARQIPVRAQGGDDARPGNRKRALAGVGR